MPSAPLILTAQDFDAFLPERGGSKAFSRPRLEVKQRALAWARGVHPRLVDLGLAVDLDASDEHPGPRNGHRVEAQHVLFTRALAERDELDRLAGRAMLDVLDAPLPPTRHAWLGVTLDAAAVEVAFTLHADADADVAAARARLDLAGGDVLPWLAALPHELEVRAGDARAPAFETGRAALFGFLDRAVAARGAVAIGWRVPREVALAHADVLGEELAAVLVALGPVHRALAWSRDDDLVGLGARLAALGDERARAHAEHAAASERWAAERKADHARLAEIARARRAAAPAWAAHRPTLASLFGPPRAKRPAPSRPHHAPHAAPAAHDDPGAHGPSEVEKGARVRVLAGAFADRVGVVSDLDGRGGARVLLGLLSARIEVADLEPVHEGRARPALSTSHTKVRG